MTSGFEKSGTVLTVHLPAELDHPASDEIRRDSDRIIGHNYIKNMIFDFSETVFMDSSGIGLLMGRYRALGMRGKCVQVVNVNSHIAKLLRLSGVGKYIEICGIKKSAGEQEGVYQCLLFVTFGLRNTSRRILLLRDESANRQIPILYR